MTKGIVLKLDGGMEEVELGSSDNEHLATLRGIVGGFVECLTLSAEPTVTMWLNEDGLRLELPYNATANLFCRAAGLRLNGSIVGPAVLAGGANAHGTLQSLPADFRATLTHISQEVNGHA